ncbi:MAG TPA: hypothetical protein VGF54_19595 [Streptosporangiaceae bacterium]|jgi:hypothetical protein
MPFIAAGSCEPLRVFTRLEPRLREVEFDDALAARIHDPMFLLARQWQFGEFAGEDGGSAVFATLARRVTPVVVGGQEGGLEPAVEALPYEFPLLQRVRLGRALATRVDAALAGVTGYDPAQARALLSRVFGPLDIAPTETVAAARERAAPRRARVRQAVAGGIDGVRAFAAFAPGMAAADLPIDFVAAVPPQHLPGYLTAFEAYRAWFAATFAPDAGRWHGDQLEYQYAATAGTVGLDAVEHTGGRLDWYGGDLVPGAATAAAGQDDIRTVIPDPAGFPGMPKPRWWQFEDSAVDLGKLRADTTDSARIVVSEFALLYGNNWFVVACRQPVGTLAELEGVVVSDVFGWRTLVSATPPSTDWTGWDLFGLAARGSGPVVQALPQHLYVPAALGHVVDGEPLESVVLVRDEGADLVWAVEQRVADGMGGSRDGAETARRLRSELAPPPAGPPIRPPGLRYVAQTDVAEHWIPFVPVHKPNDTRGIRLQRSAIARTVPPMGSLIRPATSILRTGIAADDSHAAPFFLNEEEVPRAGVVVTGRWRRARRFDGTPVVWHGRSVSTGRGGGRSGLAFDVIEQTP